MRIFKLATLVAVSMPAWAAMPAGEQNALVKKYCAVCHSDSVMNGGLSLQHYDASKRNPGLAAMILSKLNNGAMGAAGNGVPDKPTQQAWRESTKEQAAGANEWFVTREDGWLSAGIVREVPARTSGATDKPVYHLRLLCRPSVGTGEIQLTWSPQAQTGRTMSVAVDGNPPILYEIEGHESMGNGSTVQSGQASVLLSNTKNRKPVFADQRLAIRDIFPGELIEFPFSELDQGTKAEFRKCF